MKNQHAFAGVFASLVLAVSGIQTASAQLPIIYDAPWRGFFAAHAGKTFQLGIASQGDMQLKPVDRAGSPMGFDPIVINAAVLETLPNGTSVTRGLIPESLETSDPVTTKMEKVTFRAKVEGGASFEVSVEQTRGIIFAGGRILDPGTLKNPLRVIFLASFSHFYVFHVGEHAKSDEMDEREKKKLQKAFERKIQGDSLSMKLKDGKRTKQKLGDSMDAAVAKEINGPGIVEFEMECVDYPDRKILLNSSPNSSMSLFAPAAGPVYQGFTVQWTPDTAKDPEGKARLAINVR
jgi:hypothetical protein